MESFCLKLFQIFVDFVMQSLSEKVQRKKKKSKKRERQTLEGECIGLFFFLSKKE